MYTETTEKLNERKSGLEAGIKGLKETMRQTSIQQQSEDILLKARKAEIEIQKKMVLIDQQIEQWNVRLALEFSNELTPVSRKLTNKNW